MQKHGFGDVVQQSASPKEKCNDDRIDLDIYND